MTENLVTPGHRPLRIGNTTPASILSRQLLMTGPAMMIAMFAVSCGEGNDAALGDGAQSAAFALTVPLINDSNVPNRCTQASGLDCVLRNYMTDYQKGVLDVVQVSVSAGTPPSLGTCSPGAAFNSAIWNMSRSDFSARQPLLNSAQAKVSITCIGGVITNATIVALPIVLTASPQSPSTTVLDWSLPNAPASHRYNVYRDGVLVASSLNSLTFTSSIADGIGHVYAVQVDPASFPGGTPTWSPRITVMYPSMASSLWMVGTSMSRVDPTSGWRGPLNQQNWTSASGMNVRSGYLYVVSDNVLSRVSLFTGQVQALGGQNWFGTTFLGWANAGLYIWESGSIWKVDESTGAFVENGTLAWTGVSAMTSDGNNLYVVRNGTLYSYFPNNPSRRQLGASGRWANTTRMIWSWKTDSPGVSTPRLYMLVGSKSASGKLWEYDYFSNVAAPVGTDSWSFTAALSSTDAFLFLLNRNSLYKVDKQTGASTVVTTGWESSGFLAPN
jgi:hypothetical protein